MSRSTNSIFQSVNFCDVCVLVFETKKEIYKHQSNDPIQKDLLGKMFDSDFDVGLIYVRPKTETYAKTQTETKTETDSKAEVQWWIWGKKKLKILVYKLKWKKHWRENIAKTGDYDIK